MRAVNDKGEAVEWDGEKWAPVSGGAQPAPAARQPDEFEQRVRSEPLARGAFEAGLVGAGDVYNTVGINARDLWASVTGNTDAQLAIADERSEAAGIRDRLQSDNPVASRVGALASTLPLAFVGGAPAAGAGLGARMGALAGQVGMGAAQSAATSESGDFGGDAAAGGALAGVGSMAGSMVGRVNAARQARKAAQAMPGALTTAEAGVIEGAKRAGMQVLPGQASGSNQARQLEAALASNPMTSSVFQQVEQANKSQLNRLAAAAMGVQGADNVGPEVRMQAAELLSRKFEEIGDAIGEVPTAGMLKNITKIADQEADRLLPSVEAENIVRKLTRGITNRSGAAAVGVEGVDVVSGRALMKERSAIAAEMRAAFAANKPARGEMYAKVLDEIDAAAREAAKVTARNNPDAGVELARAYDTARDQWSVLRAMDRGGASIDGNVLPGQAARIAKQSDKGGFWGLRDPETGMSRLRQGTGKLGEDAQGDFYDALRFKASQIGRPIVGDSGTATRSAVGQWMQGGSTLGAVTGGVAGMAKRALLNPVAGAYTRMSPEAATAWAATAEAIKGQQGGAAATGAQIARGLMGGL